MVDSITSRPTAYRTYPMKIMGLRVVIVIDGVVNRNIIWLIYHFDRFDSNGSNSNRDKGLQLLNSSF